MSDVLPPGTTRLLHWFADDDGGSADGDPLEAMAHHAETTGYPVVGPSVGRLLSVLVRLADVERAFEFGSGFGYSAYWIARAMAAGGEIVLTDLEVDHLDRAREWFDAGGLGDRIVIEHGDAHDTVERYEGPFDLVLLDHYNRHYVDALEAVRGKLAPGGLLVADNALSGNSVFLEDLVELVEGGSPETNENTAGTVAFLEALRGDAAFETSLLPVGDGVTVSVRLP